MPPSRRTGWGMVGRVLVAQITGLDEKTIRRGQEEVAGSLADAPIKRGSGGPGAVAHRSKKRSGHRRRRCRSWSSRSRPATR